VNYYGNFAPRLALAYAPGSGRTVMRLGGGVFYDRQPPLMEQQNLLYNGRLQEITIPDPAYPNPFSQSAALMLPPPSVFEIARGIRTPYVTQEGASIERQLGKGRNYLTVEFTHLRGVKLYRLRNINAPLPGTTVHPFPNFTNINQYESSGASQSDSLAITYQATVHRRFDLLAQYTLSKSMDDTPGLLPSSTAALLALATHAYALFPANPYDLRGEWGPSDYDRRHRFNLAGIYRLPHGFKTAAIVKLASSMPYNITTGSDDNHDDIPNDRPPGLGRNTGIGPGYADVDFHFSKEFMLAYPRETSRMVIGLDAFNVFNKVNFKRFVGTQTSPFFGRANAALSARELQLAFKYRF